VYTTFLFVIFSGVIFSLRDFRPARFLVAQFCGGDHAARFCHAQFCIQRDIVDA
jgi:hypothetical protein